MRVAAFFDIDHTLIGADSGLLFVRHMLRRGELGYRDLLPPLWYSVLYRLNLLDINAVFARYQDWVRGRDHAAVTALCEEWYAREVRPRVYPEMVRRIETHRAAGHLLAVLSSATTYVAGPLARDLGIGHLLCNRLVVEDGRLTGAAVQPLCWGPGKLHWARRFAGEHDVDLSASYFYSDAISDLPMLALVGHPRPVNPDRLLRREARRRGWPVLTVS